MIVPDANLLIYAYTAEFPQHERARRWWEDTVNSQHIIGMPWLVVVAFVRITTNARVLERPLTPSEAAEHVDEWFDRSWVQILEPGPRHRALLRDLISPTKGGDIITDAHLAAMAIEANAELHSSDSDFARFQGLKWVNPLK